MRCADCKWWKAEDGKPPHREQRGECHRNAPRVPDDGNGSYRAAWPTTAASDFCGEYHVKREPVF
jgi:hypothetical protein